VHGRLDLLESLLSQIRGDLERRPARKATLVFLGDLIDRGPRSADVVERLRTLQMPGIQTTFVMGNHEEVMLRVIAGDGGLIASWLRFGGRETLSSYGLDPAAIATLPPEEAARAVKNGVPKAHVAFLSSFVDTISFGDYLFVHAGIRPGIELSQQAQSDLRWIRDPFLEDESDHGFVVVHGHTIAAEVQITPNRIGIDTGAFQSGVLTALAIDGSKRWFIQTGE
jgi:serine/threonine protein phosphatase 1